VDQLAGRALGVSDRHLRRMFEAQLGVSPLQYLQTRRLLTAKQLLADTDLPDHAGGAASGFASVRRFNAAFVAALRAQPHAAAPRGAPPAAGGGGTLVRLGYRPPYDVPRCWGSCCRRRAIEFVEHGTRRHALGPHAASGNRWAAPVPAGCVARVSRTQPGAAAGQRRPAARCCRW
jgi:AraC family transcriptional regulator of adaptative response / DNA-3-methyladenine glycosylase II